VVEVGVTTIDAPVPMNVPPHDPVNHSTTAPVPKLPPVAVKVVLPPLQIVVVPEMDVGAVDKVFTVKFRNGAESCAAQPNSELRANKYVPAVPVTAAGNADVKLAVGPWYITQPVTGAEVL